MSKIPKEVLFVTDTLEEKGYEAYLVGGCVRDILMDIEPDDWDVTTSAKPDEITALFEKTVYENDFGTVIVCVPCETENNVSRETLNTDVSRETYFKIEVTPYRIEAQYSDFRHPSDVKWSDNLKDDLKRRDFTINAMALRTLCLKTLDNQEILSDKFKFNSDKGHNKCLIDLYDGIKDIKDKMIKAVGDPDERFQEDALRMMRAARFTCQLGFSVSYETSQSIFKNANLIKKISPERIRDEFLKIIMSSNPAVGVTMLQKLGLLKNIIPELEEGVGCEQSGEHIYDVWNHLLHALQHSADKNWPLEVRLSALFHDIGKPRARRLAIQSDTENSKKKYTFYGHEVVGARMAKKVMERLKFTRRETELVEKLVRHHMFFSDTELITLSAVRRIVKQVSAENIWLLMNVRECDRVGMKKKETPYRLRKYFAMVEEALRDPISVGALKIDGEFLIKELGIKPGPRMGYILHALLEEVLDDPAKNTRKHLAELAKALDLLEDGPLKALGDRGKEKKEKSEEEEIEKLHLKHGVRK